MLRRFLLFGLVVLVALLVVLDRVGAVVGAHVLAGKVQTDERLANRPSVKIHGIPFINQAISGNYSDVSLTNHRVLVSDVSVTTLSVHLKGLHVPLSNILRGAVSQVPVDMATGTAFVSFDDANAYLQHHLPAGQVVRLTPTTSNAMRVDVKVNVSGRRVALHGEPSVSVAGNVVSLTVSRATGTSLPARTIDRVLGNLRAQFPLQAIPFQLQLHSVRLTTDGILAAGSASQIVLGSHD